MFKDIVMLPARRFMHMVATHNISICEAEINVSQNRARLQKIGYPWKWLQVSITQHLLIGDNISTGVGLRTFCQQPFASLSVNKLDVSCSG